MKGTGEFVWYDLWTRDLEAAQAFYTRVIGWDTQPFTEGPDRYVMWVAAGRPMGGSGRVPPEPDGSPGRPLWVSFVAVDDVDQTLARAQAMGGSVRTPGTDIPGVGRFGVLQDPQGARLALLSSDQEHDLGDRVRPGFVSWHELYATDEQAAWRFYSELFGWQQAGAIDMGEAGEYLMFRQRDAAPDRPVGAIFNGAKQLNTPAHWLYYITVADLEDTLQRVRDAGGQVLQEPMDVPGGRTAPCVDPQGALFALFQRS